MVRAFDARTGKLIWTFRTIPRPGEFGNDTWLNGSWATNGNTGVWAQISVDEDLGIAYLPVEGRHQTTMAATGPGTDLFGNSLVAVDLKTGQRKWHYQLVHHEMWDMDISSAPVLTDITVDGRTIKAVAQPTKQANSLCVRQGDGETRLADRGAAGGKRNRSGRMVFPDATDTHQAQGLRAHRRQRG